MLNSLPFMPCSFLIQCLSHCPEHVSCSFPFVACALHPQRTHEQLPFSFTFSFEQFSSFGWSYLICSLRINLTSGVGEQSGAEILGAPTCLHNWCNKRNKMTKFRFQNFSRHRSGSDFFPLPPIIVTNSVLKFHGLAKIFSEPNLNANEITWRLVNN